MAGFTAKNIIRGQSGDKCLVTFVMPDNMIMDCRFSRDAVKLMTSARQYEQARTGDTSTDPALSGRFDKECASKP